MIVCVHLPRFELMVAARAWDGADDCALAGRPLALAPTSASARAGDGAPPLGSGRRLGRDSGQGARVGSPARCLGEVSAAAEAHGIVQGMALSEALVRCPQLTLVPADPLGVAEAWEGVLGGLEAVGAAVQAPAPGLAFFAADGLLRLRGGLHGVLEAARRACLASGVVGWQRIGAGPTSFCALAAAASARPRKGPVVVEGGPRGARRWLAARPIELLRYRQETSPLVTPLQRLGLRRLGELEQLGVDALADRFGERGAIAHRLACGEDEPLHPRLPVERLRETIELHEADIGPALERVLLVLVERLLSRPERRGRTLRSIALFARLVEGGTWRETIVFREAIEQAKRVCLALAPRLSRLPAPAQALGVEVERFGLPCVDQGELPGIGSLAGRDEQMRSAKLTEAIEQACAAAGPYAALRVVCLQVDSRVPERRMALAPYQA